MKSFIARSRDTEKGGCQPMSKMSFISISKSEAISPHGACAPLLTIDPASEGRQQ